MRAGRRATDVADWTRGALRPASVSDWFAWPRAPDAAAWAWIPLGLLVATPWPMFGWPLPERGVPIMWLLAGGLLLLAARVAEVSWPAAALIVWAGLRAAYHGFPLRSLQVLALLAFGLLLYRAARTLPDRAARIVAAMIVAGVLFQAALGLLNATGEYPWMVWVAPEHKGKPMGLLTHPNYWGSFIALGLPLVWALCGIPAALTLYLLNLRTVSGGPVISASVAMLVMAWPLFGRRTRVAVAASGAASIAVVMTLHEWRLSGRWEVWREGVRDLWRWPWPLIGEGLGSWRTWAEGFNQGLAPELKARSPVFATLQAHNEPLQLWFELGLVGLALAGLWLWQSWRASRVVWRAAPAAVLPSAWLAWGRAPLERAWLAVAAATLVNSLGSPTFHLPAQAAIALFALARIQADAAAFSAGPAPSLAAQWAASPTAGDGARPRRQEEPHATTTDR